MVGQLHRLGPGPVLHAVYPCLDRSEAVLHPWNTERGTFHPMVRNSTLESLSTQQPSWQQIQRVSELIR